MDCAWIIKHNTKKSDIPCPGVFDVEISPVSVKNSLQIMFKIQIVSHSSDVLITLPVPYFSGTSLSLGITLPLYFLFYIEEHTI